MIPHPESTGMSTGSERDRSSHTKSGSTASASATAPIICTRVCPIRSANAPNPKQPPTKQTFSTSELPNAWAALKPKAFCTNTGMKISSTYTATAHRIEMPKPASSAPECSRKTRSSGSGAGCRVCSARNAGVSSRVRRRYRPSGTMQSPIRNGMRQPQLTTAPGGSSAVTAKATSAPRMFDMPMLACSQAVNSPLLPAGACSTKKAAALPISPPAENPCMMRPASSSSGAPTPIAANGGEAAMISVPPAMTRMVAVKAALRPARSP